MESAVDEGNETTCPGVATAAGCAAMTNGHVGGSSPESETAAATSSTVTKPEPKIIEAFRSSEKFGENSSDVEKFSSKLTEVTDVGDRATTKEKQYEEKALKAMTEKTDNTSLSSTTEMNLDQMEKVKTSDTGAVNTKFAENQEKKHELETTSTDRIGDNITATISTSEKSKEKSSMSIETSTDGPSAVLVDIGSDTSSNTMQETKGENFSSSRKVARSKSEQQFQYSTSSDSQDAVGVDRGRPPLDKEKIDYEKRYDDLFDSHGSYRREKPKPYEIPEHFDDDDDRWRAEVSRARGQVGFRDQVEEIGSEYGTRSAHARPDLDSDLDYVPGSRSSHRLGSRYYGHSKSLDEGMEEYDQGREYNSSRWGLSTDRKTADDLVRRILSESRGGGGGRSALYEGRSVPPPHSATLGSREFEEPSFSPILPPPAGRIDRIKVDMADGGIINDIPKTMEENADFDDASFTRQRSAKEVGFKSEHETSSSLVSDSMDHVSGSERMSGRLVETERLPCLPARPVAHEREEMSLLDRRLASMGFDKKLNQQVVLGDKGASCEGYVETTYISKKKPPVFNDGDEDDFDDEINKLRSNYMENLERRNRILQDDYAEEDEIVDARPPPPPGALQGYRARGRMVRQEYVDDGDSVTYSKPPKKKPSLPDDAFVPKKRAETEEIVKEKTTHIREMIERQSSALEKLRDASSSFDELEDEIKNIKQQLIENQLRRSNTMSDDFDQQDDEEQPAPYAPVDYGYKGYVSRAERSRLERDTEDAYDVTGARAVTSDTYGSRQYGALDDGYVPYVPRKQRLEASSRTMSLYDDYGEDLGRSRRRFDQQDDDDAPGYGSYPASSHGSYSSVSSYSSISASSYRSRPTFTRANTLSDFNFDRPSSIGSYGSYSRSDRYDRPSSFSSRFLDKVRERRQSGEVESSASTRRDKPFTSRFLRDTYSTSSPDTPSNYTSRSSEVSSSSTSVSTKSATAGDASATAAATETAPETKPSAESQD